MEIKIRKAHEAVARVTVDFSEENPKALSRAKQSFAQEADINNIMARYQKTGLMVEPGTQSGRRPQYGDFSNGMEYREIMERVTQAKQDFALLDSETRKLHGNDVSNYLDSIANQLENPETPETPPETPETPPEGETDTIEATT